MPKYIYDGPVMVFDTCVVGRWRGETIAASEAKARSNSTYQYKKNNSLIPGSKITLPGRITMAEERSMKHG